METETVPTLAELPNTPEAHHLLNGWHELGHALDVVPAAALEARAAIEARRTEYATRLAELAAERAKYLTTREAPIRGRLA